MKTSFPIEGWDMNWKKNNDHEVAFNIHSCFYLQALEHYGVTELVSLYCRSDDLIGEALPESIRWERSNTLGRGGKMCDFRWIYQSE